MSDPLILFGCGGHAKVLLEAIRARHPDRRVAIVDDAPAGEILGVAVSGTRDWLSSNMAGARVALGVGGNSARFSIMDWLASQGRELETIIHPSAVIGATVSVAPGAFIAAGTVLIAEARIGRGAIVNTAASVDHDCVVGEAAHIGPGVHLCGNVKIGARTLVGVGSSIAPGISIGPDTVIGAGSAVIRDVPGGTTYVGCPARPVKTA